MKPNLISLQDFAMSCDYFVAAHRGASALAPENTLSAIQAAVNVGADLIEIDIQITKDKKVVAFHGFEESLPNKPDIDIKNISYQDIKKIDFGSWFSKNFAGEKIPLLKDVIELVFDKCYLMIELKSDGKDIDYEMAELTISEISSYNYIQHTIFGSFDLDLIKKLKENFNDIHIAAIKNPYNNSTPIELKKATNCEAIVCSIDEYTEEFAEEIKLNNLFAGVYGIDKKESLIKAIQLGAKALVTDNPLHIKESIQSISSR